MEKEICNSFKKLSDGWPSEFIARKRISQFTGGLVSPKTMANYDSLGRGPQRIKLGKNVGYPKAQLIAWLKSRFDFIHPKAD